MFDDFSVFDAEDIDSSLAAVVFIELDVVVDKDQVTVGADVLNHGRTVGVGLQEIADTRFKGCFAVGKFRAVLFVIGTDHAVDDGCVVFVKDFVPKVFGHGLVALKGRNARSQG